MMIHLFLFISFVYDPQKEEISMQMIAIYPNWHMQRSNTKVYKQSRNTGRR